MVRLIFPLCLIASLFAGHCLGETATLSFETPYNHITIERGGSIVEMRSVWRSKMYRESAVDLSDPSRLVVPYTSFIAASAMFHANPRSVLMIGLGAAGLINFSRRLSLLPLLKRWKSMPRYVFSPRNTWPLNLPIGTR